MRSYAAGDADGELLWSQGCSWIGGIGMLRLSRFAEGAGVLLVIRKEGPKKYVSDGDRVQL